MSINDRNIDIKELKKGIQMILRAFNEQKEKYLKIINSMKEKISLLEEQVIKLKEENNLYQNKLYTLQKNIKCISKTICQIKDEEESNESKNISDMDKSDKSNSSELDQNLKIKLTKDKNKDFFKKHSLNKLEMKKTTKNNKNQEINDYFREDNNIYRREDDIQIKKKDRNDNNYLKNLYKTINNKKYNIKKESLSGFSKIANYDKNDYVRYTEIKNDKEIKENLYETNNNDSNEDK